MRRRIVTETRRHFFSHGFRSVTMDDLAVELGMSKKTLYAHFSGKDALLEAVLADKFRDIERDFADITSACASDVLGALHRLLACIQHHTEEVRPPLVRDMRRAPALFKGVEDRRRDHIQRHFGKLLREGRRAGVIRKDVRIDLIMDILLAAVQAVMNPQKMAELGLTPHTGYAAIINVIFEGALTRSARSNR